jgi:hypothetical protein
MKFCHLAEGVAAMTCDAILAGLDYGIESAVRYADDFAICPSQPLRVPSLGRGIHVQ